MNKLNYLRGSLVAIVTPFNDEGFIDFDALGKLIDYQISNGTSGIVVAGTTGESAALTESEYAELIRFSVKHVNGEVPVIVGAGSNVTASAIKHSVVAKREGADGLLIINPYYNKPTDEGIFLYYKRIAENVDLPIIAYNVPGRTGSNISAELMLRIAHQIPNVIAVKEASGDLGQIMEIIANRPQGFKVFSGDDAQALAIIASGGDGCISVVANQAPADFSRMINAALENDIVVARQLHYRLFSLMNLNFIESNPIPVKTSLHLMGMIANNYREPIIPSENPRTTQLLSIELETLGLLNSSLSRKQVEKV